ncbi:MAG: tRNA (adenosine(37)-N6)-dimethylallyltransferase MiaA, partial [Planctomycetaceae bacterium]|nr:tRNA (adenosine(37)-N6)-dimethylallyltransferase MiaA [Planctomycetaceae bacterium]
GEATLAQAIETVQTRTRQFAKRQETWFRNLVECRPAPLTGAESAEEVAMRLARLGQAANRH